MDYELGNDFAADDVPKAVQATHVAMTRPLTAEEVESFAYHPQPRKAYEPTAEDLADYAAWSQSVHDHQMALNVWLTFFPDEEQITLYVS